MASYPGEGPYVGKRIVENINHHPDRICVYIEDVDANTRVHTLRSRYRMAVKENRILGQSEEVDHVDANSRNDDLNNLQLLDSQMNLLKMRYDSMSVERIVHGVCPICGSHFERSERQTAIRKNQSWDTCSPNCGHLVQHRLPNIPAGHIDRMVVEKIDGDEFLFDPYTIGDAPDLSKMETMKQMLEKRKVRFVKK